ncbi:hypothetical protein DFH29DRAFT_879023 [Suillus ampliporus]|nr:hypothetical protein DFH29DRAFT_879023 [Suillus ampliporus]
MAPRNTTKKPLGSPAVSPAPESPATTSSEESEVSWLEVHSPWCMICHDGAEGDVVLYECNACPRVMCNKCIDVPSDSLQLVPCPNVLFQCLACHSQRTVKEPAPFHRYTNDCRDSTKGACRRKEGNLPSQDSSWLNGNEVVTPVPFLSHYLQHYFPNGGYIYLEEARVADLKSHLGVVDSVFVFFSDHSEEDSWLAFCLGKKEVLSTVLGLYHTILKGAIMVFLVCGSLVAHEDTFGDLQEAILNYDMDICCHLSHSSFPTSRRHELLACCGGAFFSLSPAVLVNTLRHQLLVTTFARAHAQVQPWGIDVPAQCPLCGSTKSWSERVAVVLHDKSVDLDAQDQAPVSRYLYSCTYPHCGKAQGKPCHKFHIDKPPGFMVNAAKSKTSGWFQSPSTIFPLLPSVLSLPIISASSSTQGKRPRSSDGKGSTEKRMTLVDGHVIVFAKFAKDNVADSSLRCKGILALHQDGFVAASQETHRGILRTVRDHIVTENQSQDESVELPKALKKAIRHHYHQFLTDEDDIQAEEELLEDEPCGPSPEEREAEARPKDAAFYKREANDWDVTQKLFKQEMDEYDKEEQAKLGVNNEIKYRTGHARKWFNNMTPAQQKEVEDAKEKWNREGAPPESQAIHESKPINSKKPFKQSSRGNKEWTSEGFKKFVEWSKSDFYPEENDNKSDKEEDDDDKTDLPELILDKNGFPKLPSRVGVPTRGQQELVRRIFRTSYKVFTETDRPVPWHEVVGNPTLYLKPNSLPEDFILRDLSHLRAENINDLWAHWEAKKASREKLVIFAAAKLGDVNKKLIADAVPYQGKSKKKYVELDEDAPARPGSSTHTEQPARVAASSKGVASTHPTTRTTRPAEGDSSEGEAAAAASTARRSGLAEGDSSEGMAARPSSAQLGAPAMVPIKDRIVFLKSLSSNSDYLLLVEGIKDLDKEPSSKQQKEWPTWATWSWEGSYLPSSVHSVDGEVQKFLETVMSAKISGLLSAIECKRAIEYEPDEPTPDTPAYVSASRLGINILDLVIEAVNMVRGRVIQMLKARDSQQVEKSCGKEEERSQLKEKQGKDEEELKQELECELQKFEEEKRRGEELKEQIRMLEEEKQKREKLKEEMCNLEEQTRKLQEATEILEKQREEQEKLVAKERKGDDDEEEVEAEEGAEEEVRVELKGKKRTKSGGSRKPSKKAKSDIWPDMCKGYPGQHQFYAPPRPARPVMYVGYRPAHALCLWPVTIYGPTAPNLGYRPAHALHLRPVTLYDPTAPNLGYRPARALCLRPTAPARPAPAATYMLIWPAHWQEKSKPDPLLHPGQT